MVARVVAWGGYDDSKPRVRLLLDSLRRQGALAGEVHVPVWREIEDKSVADKAKLLRAVGRWLAGMPRALWHLATLPRGQNLLLPYPGTPDIFLAAIFAWLAGRKIVLDAFLPIHDTIVRDRALLHEGSFLSRLIWRVERAGLRLADVVLVDTDQHGDFLSHEFAIDRARFVTVLVGAEPQFDRAQRAASPVRQRDRSEGRFRVLFYGQLIPLHGVETILDAALLTAGEDIDWTIVGKGQLEPLVHQFMVEHGGKGIEWIPWVEYQALPDLIESADLCLGVFGGSGKAGRVIPNKLFQVLAMGKPVVTRSSPAVDDLAALHPETIMTIAPEDPEALANAVRRARAQCSRLKSLPPEKVAELGPDPGVRNLLALVGAK